MEQKKEIKKSKEEIEKENLIKSIILHHKNIKLQKQQNKESKKLKDDLLSFIWILKEMKKKQPPKKFANDNVELLMKKITEYEEEKCYRTLFDIYEIVENVTCPDWKEINKLYVEKIKQEMDFNNQRNYLEEFFKQ